MYKANFSAYSLYYRRWMENFDSSQVLVIDGTDMIKSPWVAAQKAQVKTLSYLLWLTTQRNLSVYEKL